MTRSEDPQATARVLRDWVEDARTRTFELVADLEGPELLGPQIDIINPVIWEIGHTAWFQEKWVLRHVAGCEPLRADADQLWDSIAIAHDRRWDLPLPSREETLAYLAAVRDRVLEVLERSAPRDDLFYFVMYSVFHEDMHSEALTYTRQTLGYPPPQFSVDGEGSFGTVPVSHCSGDVVVGGGSFRLGAEPTEPFVFDNEKWSHPVELEPFSISRTAVTQEEFAAFVDDGGYARRGLWSNEGWKWRESEAATRPAYWRSAGSGRWQRRHFDRWVDLEPRRPVIHVNWFEAEAYCRWAKRRLPTEAEWEAAASLPTAEVGNGKRRFPWGDRAPTAKEANLDWAAMGPVDVDAFSEGDSACGCRQLLGNVWEWTLTRFGPYPGFVADPYKEYSEPWFDTRRVLRGGAWTTRSRMLRNTWRNYYTPERRDVLAGFRTCALEP